MTQLNLADEIYKLRPNGGNFTEQSVANLESGVTQDPKLTTMRDIAQVLQVSIDWLVFGHEFQRQPPTTVDDLKLRICEQIDAMVAGVTRQGDLSPAALAWQAAARVGTQASQAQASREKPHRPRRGTGVAKPTDSPRS